MAKFKLIVEQHRLRTPLNDPDVDLGAYDSDLEVTEKSPGKITIMAP